MAYIFLDESGDLGFDVTKSRSSKYFVITLLFAQDKKPIEKIIKNVHANLKKTHKQKGGVLHCYHEKPVTRNRMLTKLSQKDIKVMTIYLNKQKVYTRLHEEVDVLYNYVTNLLLDRICTKKVDTDSRNGQSNRIQKRNQQVLKSKFQELSCRSSQEQSQTKT